MSVMIITALGIAGILLLYAVFSGGNDFAQFAAIWAVCIVFGIICIEIHMEWLPIAIAALISIAGWWQQR